MEERMMGRLEGLMSSVVGSAVQQALSKLPAVSNGNVRRGGGNGRSSGSESKVDNDMLGQLATAIGGGVVGTGGSNNSSSGSGAGGPVEFEDESDGENGEDGVDNLADQELKGATAGLDGVDRMAPSILAHAKTFGSLIGWVRTVEWKHTRNKNECLALAQAVDLLLAEGVPVSSMGIELLLRRLNGVHLADSFNNWGVCTLYNGLVRTIHSYLGQLSPPLSNKQLKWRN